MMNLNRILLDPRAMLNSKREKGISLSHCYKPEKMLPLALLPLKGALHAPRRDYWNGLLCAGKSPYQLRSGKDGGDQ
jgi:hypothetical protein